jgi:hypothetical protein
MIVEIVNVIVPEYHKASMKVYYRRRIHTYLVRAYVGVERDEAVVGIDLEFQIDIDIGDPVSGSAVLTRRIDKSVELGVGKISPKALRGLLSSLNCHQRLLHPWVSD